MAPSAPVPAGAPDPFLKELTRLAEVVANAQDADVLVYSGEIRRFLADDELIDKCKTRPCARNVFFLLATYGGDADAAYRMARTLQTKYEKVIVFIHGYCKSAGTLLAIGANELVLSPSAEIGPLDVQVRKADEAGERSSGLTPTQALDSLSVKAFECFNYQFGKLRTELEMTTKMAAAVAAKLTTALFAPIYRQIEPMRLGELARALRVALDYGERLNRRASNVVSTEALARLVHGYPSHSFDIDIAEAKEIFRSVRTPTSDEAVLAEHIAHYVRYPRDQPILQFVGAPRVAASAALVTEVVDVAGPTGSGGGSEPSGEPAHGGPNGEGEQAESPAEGVGTDGGSGAPAA